MGEIKADPERYKAQKERWKFYNDTRRERYAKKHLEEALQHAQGAARQMIQDALNNHLSRHLKKHEVDALIKVAYLSRAQPVGTVCQVR